MAKKNTSEPTFGELERQLELQVSKLESGDLPLEDAIATYEEANETLKLAQKRLNAAEQKVRTLNGEDERDDDAQEAM